MVVTFPMPVGTRFEWHAHADHQIAWSPEGVLVVLTEGGGSYVLPPSRALWIPAGTVHETQASGAAVLRSVYLEPDSSRIAGSIIPGGTFVPPGVLVLASGAGWRSGD